jgi:hypothetical protein
MLYLAHDWLGPEGYWPNAQSLDFYTSYSEFDDSSYAPNNARKSYGLESKQHQFTHSKINSILMRTPFEYTDVHISNVTEKCIYEITPLLKPYQWCSNAFDHVSEVAKTIQRAGNCLFLINDMNEGYGNADYNLFENLHKQISLHKLLPENIAYITMNSSIEEEYKSWCNANNVSTPIVVRSVYLYEWEYSVDYNKIPTHHYIFLNRQPNPHRQALMYALWQKDLLKYGKISMPAPTTKLEWEFDKIHAEQFGLDTSRWQEFVDTLPYIVDGKDAKTQDCTNDSIHSHYQDCILSIVTEQRYDEPDCVKFTEKTFSSFANKCMPLYFCSAGFTKELNKIGYNIRFNDYDVVYDNVARFNTLVNTIEKLCKIDISTLHTSTVTARMHNFRNINRRYSNWHELNTKGLFEKWIS